VPPPDPPSQAINARLNASTTTSKPKALSFFIKTPYAKARLNKYIKGINTPFGLCSVNPRFVGQLSALRAAMSKFEENRGAIYSGAIYSVIKTISEKTTLLGGVRRGFDYEQINHDIIIVQ